VGLSNLANLSYSTGFLITINLSPSPLATQSVLCNDTATMLARTRGVISGDAVSPRSVWCFYHTIHSLVSISLAAPRIFQPPYVTFAVVHEYLARIGHVHLVPQSPWDQPRSQSLIYLPHNLSSYCTSRLPNTKMLIPSLASAAKRFVSNSYTENLLFHFTSQVLTKVTIHLLKVQHPRCAFDL